MATFDRTDHQIMTEMANGTLPIHVLRSLLQETTTARDQLECENEILAHYIERHGISSDSPGAVFDSSPKRHVLRLKQNANRVDRVQGLSVLQKYNVATIESEFFRQRLRDLVMSCETTIENYRAILEECTTRRSEIKKQFMELDAAVLSVDPIYGTQIPKVEDFLNYHHKVSKSRDNIILQCRLKNPLLKSAIKKLTFEVHRAASNEYRPRRVDFDCLIQMNNECIEQIQERNRQLRNLKLMSSHVMQMLHVKKQHLKKVVAENAKLTRGYVKRFDRCNSVALNVQATIRELKSEKTTKMRLIMRPQRYRVPATSAFVESTMLLQDIERETKYRTRQNHISRVVYEQHKRLWNAINRNRRDINKPADRSSLART